MKYNLKKYLIIVVVAMFASPLFAQENLEVDSTKTKINLSEQSLVDEVIAVVGNKAIFLSDIYTQETLWKQQRGLNPNAKLSQTEKLSIFENLLTQKLLAISAIADSLPAGEVAAVGRVEERINSMIAQVGSQQALEEMMHTPIYLIREALMFQVVEENLANAMRREIVKDVAITPLDVKRYVKTVSVDSLEIIPRQIEYSQIVVLPPSDYDAKLKVKADLLELRRRIAAGDSFSALARLYSDDVATAKHGGLMDYSLLDKFVEPFKDAVKTLNVGGISGIVETEYGFHIIKLEDKRNNLYQLRHILMRTELDADQMQGAMTKLDSIANEIRDGKITFEEAAAKYSDDKKTKFTGGEVLNQQTVMMMGAKGQSPMFYEDELQYDAQAVLSLKVGEISNSYVSYDPLTGTQIVKIVKLNADHPAHKAQIDKDYTYFEDKAKSNVMDSIFDKWIIDKISKTFIVIHEPYKYSKFTLPWLKNEK